MKERERDKKNFSLVFEEKCRSLQNERDITYLWWLPRPHIVGCRSSSISLSCSVVIYRFLDIITISIVYILFLLHVLFLNLSFTFILFLPFFFYSFFVIFYFNIRFFQQLLLSYNERFQLKKSSFLPTYL